MNCAPDLDLFVVAGAVRTAVALCAAGADAAERSIETCGRSSATTINHTPPTVITAIATPLSANSHGRWRNRRRISTTTYLEKKKPGRQSRPGYDVRLKLE